MRLTGTTSDSRLWSRRASTRRRRPRKTSGVPPALHLYSQRRSLIVFVMRHGKLLISSTVLITAAAAVAVLRPHRPVLSLSASRVEAIEVSGKGGGVVENWAVTAEVANVSPDWVTLDNQRIEVVARVANRWVPVERPDFWRCMSSGADGELRLLVPAGAEACRVSLGYVPYCRWYSSSIEDFLRFNPVCQRFVPIVCDWAADHTPKLWLWRHISFELAVPRASTWASPKVSGAHNPRSAADAGIASRSSHCTPEAWLRSAVERKCRRAQVSRTK